MKYSCLFLLAVFLTACSSEPKEAAKAPPAPAKREAPKPRDERHRFPSANQVDSKVEPDHLLGHEWMRGGNVATYKKGKQEYQLIVVRTGGPEAAAIMLLDFKNHMENPKLIAHFGGYFGRDGGKPAFVFAKGDYFAGVIGLPEQQADMVARDFAARLN
jgi:hypothetical protein